MRFYFDTEFFEDGKTIDLMTIGIACENGETLYLGNREFDFRPALASPWHRENTLPHLAPLGDRLFWRSRADLQGSILGWVKKQCAGSLADRIAVPHAKPEWWAYYADYDWVALCQLFGRMIDLPAWWPKYCNDLKQLERFSGVSLKKMDGAKQHDALSDALWLKGEVERLLAAPRPTQLVHGDGNIQVGNGNVQIVGSDD